jgi:hypothetical protein
VQVARFRQQIKTCSHYYEIFIKWLEKTARTRTDGANLNQIDNSLDSLLKLGNRVFHICCFAIDVSTSNCKYLWTERALETVNCFAFLTCKLTVVVRAC